MDSLIDAIKIATIAGIIQWKPTAEVRNAGKDCELRGYTTQYRGFTLTTIVRDGENLSSAEGLSIEKKGKILVLTSDPNVIPGQKKAISHLVYWLQQHIESRDLGASLLREINRDFLGLSSDK